MVRHVPTAVEVDRREHGIAEEPAPDEVVQLPVREEQPVRRLVHQDVVAGDDRPHREKRDDPDDRGVRPDRDRDDADGEGVQQTTVSALRNDGIRRSSSRQSGPAWRPA